MVRGIVEIAQVADVDEAAVLPRGRRRLRRARILRGSIRRLRRHRASRGQQRQHREEDGRVKTRARSTRKRHAGRLRCARALDGCRDNEDGRLDDRTPLHRSSIGTRT
jgi:hypothetical protein